jgi:hypothetical protein
VAPHELVWAFTESFGSPSGGATLAGNLSCAEYHGFRILGIPGSRTADERVHDGVHVGAADIIQPPLSAPLESSWNLPLRSLQCGDRKGLVQYLAAATADVPRGEQVGPGSASAHVPTQTYSRTWHGDELTSPLEEIDDFVRNLVNGTSRGEPPGLCDGVNAGRVKSWTMSFAEDASGEVNEIKSIGRWSITYQIGNKYRFCERIGRPHRSNNVMIVVFFYVSERISSNGKSIVDVDGHWRQRCFDPECRGFNFPVRQLLPSLLGEIRVAVAVGKLDALLCLSARQVPASH